MVMIEIMKIRWCFIDKLGNYSLLYQTGKASHVVFHISCDLKVQDTALETFDKKYSQVNGNSERND